MLIACCALPLIGGADERPAGVYESLDAVRIGRVFLSAEQRQELDARRGLDPAAASSSSTEAATTEAAKAPTSKGFIRAEGKPTRVFRDGDFVRTDGRNPVRFSTEGTIRRHQPAANDESEPQ